MEQKETYRIKAKKDGLSADATLVIEDIIEENVDYTILKLIIGNQKWHIKSDTTAFRALIELRKKISPIKLYCYGLVETCTPRP